MMQSLLSEIKVAVVLVGHLPQLRMLKASSLSWITIQARILIYQNNLFINALQTATVMEEFSKKLWSKHWKCQINGSIDMIHLILILEYAKVEE